MLSAKLHKYGQNWGGRSLGWWFEFIAGPYRVDFYWESINGWRRIHVGLGGRALIAGPLTVIAQNWQRKAP